jgi:AraC family ethanolamine operon transcriptional activator
MRTCDLVSLAGLLRVATVELVLLDEHGPRVEFHSAVSDDAMLCTFEAGTRFRGRFELPPDWCLLGFVHGPGQRDSWCHGASLLGGTALVVRPEGVSEFFLDAGASLSLVVLPSTRLNLALAGASLPGAGGSNLGSGPLVCGDQPEALQLQRLYQQVRNDLLDGQLDNAGQVVVELLSAHVDFLMAADASARPAFPRGRRGYYQMLQRAEAYMRLHMRGDLSIEEVCDAAGASERTLRYAFEHLMHTSPKRYLSMLRLCAACHGLAMADASRRSVRSVAMSCGLWDLSRFAESYRRVFGELPSETLMRLPPAGALPADGQHV